MSFLLITGQEGIIYVLPVSIIGPGGIIIYVLPISITEHGKKA